MFEERKERRRLEREYLQIHEDFKATNPPEKSAEYKEFVHKLSEAHKNLKDFEDKAIKERAAKYGVHIPFENKLWWEDHLEFGDWRKHIQLSDIGKANVSKLIKDERRKIFGFWAAIIFSGLAGLTGIIGAIIGIVAILKK